MGTSPHSGKRVDADVAGMFRFEDGKIVEMWVIWDNVGIMTQRGHLGPPAPADSVTR